MQRISPPTSRKVQLQIILNTQGQPYTFHFNTQQPDRDGDLARREEMKTVLARLLPVNRDNVKGSHAHALNNGASETSNAQSISDSEARQKSLYMSSLEEKKR